MNDIVTASLTEDRWADVVALFGNRGDPSWCWCQYFVTTGSSYSQSADANMVAFRDQVISGARPPGQLAYAAHNLAGPALGWVQVGPRTSYPRVCGNRARQAVARRVADDLTDESVWAVTCFVVKVGQRGTGATRPVMRLTL